MVVFSVFRKDKNMRRLSSFLAGLLFASAAFAQTLPSPIFSRVTIGIAANYAPTNGYFAGASAQSLNVRGSSSAPDATANPAAIFQKWSGYAGTSNSDASVYSSMVKTSNVAGTGARAAFFEAQDNAGWSGTGGNTFVEGAKFSAFLGAGASLGSAYGAVSAAYNTPGVQYTYLIGTESVAMNNYADAPAVFANSSFAAAFLAGNGGNHSIDAFYTIGPYISAGGTARRGFYVPAGATTSPVTGAAFQSDSATANVLVGPKIVIDQNGAIKSTSTTAPTLTGNGQASFYASLTGGAQIGGNGQFYDVQINNSAGSAALGVVHNSQSPYFFGMAYAPAGIRYGVIAVASLPTCNSGAEGTLYSVNDANSATFNATLAGGGSNHVMGYCNGSNWTVH